MMMQMESFSESGNCALLCGRNMSIKRREAKEQVERVEAPGDGDRCHGGRRMIAAEE
jgi:hypothetical protein